MNERTYRVWGGTYRARVFRRRRAPLDAPRLVVVAYQPNPVAREVLRLCLDTIRHFTPEPHELWVVDNGSPAPDAEWLVHAPDLNVIVLDRPPQPPWGWFGRVLRRRDYRYWGTFRNAVALEIAAATIDPDSRLMMTLHMDTMACRTGWLSYLRRHLNDRVRAVGVRLDTTRVRTLHSLGMMFDFTLFRPLGLTFRHNMPHWDVGDAVSMGLERAGYDLWSCRNADSHPDTVPALPEPFRSLPCDRAVDDEGDVIFMHLGRGIVKSTQGTPPGKLTPEAWVRFGREVVLGGGSVTTSV